MPSEALTHDPLSELPNYYSNDNYVEIESVLTELTAAEKFEKFTKSLTKRERLFLSDAIRNFNTALIERDNSDDIEDFDNAKRKLKSVFEGVLHSDIFDKLKEIVLYKDEAGGFGRVAPGDYLEDDQEIYAEAVADRVLKSLKLATALSAAFQRRGIVLPTVPESVSTPPVVIADSTPFWKGRAKDDRRNPVEFIQANYGEMRNGAWHHNGLTRPDLKRDPELYVAYAQWIKPDRHPEDALDFASGGRKPGRARIEDPADAIDRMRLKARERAAARKRTNTQFEPR